MKMKLAQRMALGYYTTKFRALSLISPGLAAAAVFRLFCTPYSGKPRRNAPPVFNKGEVISFSSNGETIRGWRWLPSSPNGKKVLIVHGFDSCSYRFDRYIVPLQREGFEVVAFDAPGHGMSSGKRVNALAYSQAIQLADELFGRFDAIMAHSLGGLATSLAFERLPAQEQRRLVLIAPTTETTSAIENFFRFVRVTPAVQQAFLQLIEQIGQQPAHYYSVSRAIADFRAQVLWIHDEEDRVCPYCDTIPVQERQLPHVQFYITRGFGHSGIYRQNEVFRKIMQFLASETGPSEGPGASTT